MDSESLYANPISRRFDAYDHERILDRWLEPKVSLQPYVVSWCASCTYATQGHAAQWEGRADGDSPMGRAHLAFVDLHIGHQPDGDPVG